MLPRIWIYLFATYWLLVEVAYFTADANVAAYSPLQVALRDTGF